MGGSPPGLRTDLCWSGKDPRSGHDRGVISCAFKGMLVRDRLSLLDIIQVIGLFATGG